MRNRRRRAEELYERVLRLDEGSFGDARSGSPARSLLNRLERSRKPAPMQLRRANGQRVAQREPVDLGEQAGDT